MKHYPKKKKKKEEEVNETLPFQLLTIVIEN